MKNTFSCVIETEGMDHSRIGLVVLAGLVALSGCAGVLPFGDDSSPKPDDNLHPPESQQNISFVNNNNTTDYEVTIQVVRNPVQAVNLTLASGETVTKSIDPESPLPLSNAIGSTKGKVTAVEPVNATLVAHWSTVVKNDSLATLPLNVERENVTYLVVAHERPPSERDSTIGTLIWCEPPSQLELLTIRLGDEGHTSRCGD